MPKKIAVLGATGSIGKSALDVIACGKNDFEVVLLSAHNNREGLAEAGRMWPGAATILSGEAGGRERLLDAIANSGADITLNGISGAAGLEPSMAAIAAGSDLALANKETLVMAGPLVFEQARQKKVQIIPVDSEHSAVFHLLQAHCPMRLGARRISSDGYDELDEVILTASGGPFREYSVAEMEKVSPAAALDHPTWNMGAKITIDSATMANKGLEVIEAAHLFGLPPEKITVVIHPQSIVHSMIRMKDGALYAQLSRPDMRLPIHKALYWPKVQASDFGRLDFGNVVADTQQNLALEFYPPDMEKFPMLAYAYEAARKGGLYPCVYNAANEAAVAAFLSKRIGFLDIGRITRYVLDTAFSTGQACTKGPAWNMEACDIASVLEADKQARIIAEKGLSC